jgi:hypothetical protein
MYCFEREKKESPFIEGRIEKQQQPQTSSGGSKRERTIPIKHYYSIKGASKVYFALFLLPLGEG